MCIQIGVGDHPRAGDIREFTFVSRKLEKLVAIEVAGAQAAGNPKNCDDQLAGVVRSLARVVTTTENNVSEEERRRHDAGLVHPAQLGVDCRDKRISCEFPRRDLLVDEPQLLGQRQQTV